MDRRLTGSAWASGLILFAAIMMLMVGIFHALEGLAAILRDTFYVVTPNYIFEVDATVWGWIHLLLGILVAVAGGFLLTGQTWARWLAMAAAAVSAVVNFGSIPYYPVWSVLIIALDIAIIWALATHGRDLAD